MNIIKTNISGVLIIEPTIFEDNRGFFQESYNKLVFDRHGINNVFVQDNHSKSTETHVLRGLHFQTSPMAQTKLVRVISGAIYDVVVDLRKSSATYGNWVGVILSNGNKRQLYIPKGFAHGLCTLVPNTEVLYKVDQYYSPEHEQGIAWDDPTFEIIWPTKSPILSSKDEKHEKFDINKFYFE